MSRVIQIDPKDNVAVALQPLQAGETSPLGGMVLNQDIPQAHKYALVPIALGEQVIKYGYPIGQATVAIKAGDWIHSHNMKTNLSGVLEYSYKKVTPVPGETPERKTFQGYRRADGKVGIRNELWIINTVGCVNQISERISREANRIFADRSDGIYSFSHPYGCSQLGDDHSNTQLILKNLVQHPNAGAVLVLGLGCENNHIKAFKQVLGEVDEKRVRFLETQGVEDEIESAIEIIGNQLEIMSKDSREECGLEDLTIGLKCGGSDGLSGITANPMLGEFSDMLIQGGGSSLLSEVPEMFGAETVLMNQAKDEKVFNQTVSLVNEFKEYFQRYNQVVYENPSPGNKEGGITTLEEKSLGCIRKGGHREVQDVLAYGETLKEKGLNLLDGPGNDIVAVTNLISSGAQIVLFTTGRGTPLGGPVPTVKVSTNNTLAAKKSNWIDFNAGTLVDQSDMDHLKKDFFNYILDVASGEKTRNEINGYREIAIFKDGVTL